MDFGKKVRLIGGVAVVLIATWVGQSWGEDDDIGPLRVGYTDHMVLIPALPEFRDAQRQLTEQNAADQATLQEMYASFQGGMAEYEAQKNMLTVEQRTKKETDLVAKQTAIEQKAGELDSKLSERQSQLIGPIYERVDEAIQSVAKGRGLDLVLRIQMAPNEPSILYANEDRVVDITREVADLLGLPRSEDGK